MRAHSKNFIALSGASERRTREVINQMESVASALRQVDPHFAGEGDPTNIVLMAKTRDVQPYFELLIGRSKSAGAFVTNPEGTGTMLIDASRPFVDGTVVHELVHSLFAISGTRFPLWLEEGIAEYFSTAEVWGENVRFGKPISAHVILLRNRPLTPFAELFAATHESDIATTGFFYAESWAIVDWMMRADRSAFFAFAKDLEEGAEPLEALRNRFHLEPLLVERTLFKQVKPPAILTIRVEKSPEAAVVEPIFTNEAVIELATFLGGFETTRGDAERFLKSLPQTGRTVATIAALRAKERKYDEATKLYDQALRLAPSEPEIRLGYAEALLGNALGPFSGTSDIESDAVPRFRRARNLAAEALGGGGDPSRANAVIGTSYLIEDDPTPGIEPLLRARSARPSRYDIALSLYALLMRSGDSDSATNLYKDIAALAKTPQAIFAARAVFVREQLALVNRLLAANRVDDASLVLSQLIDITPDDRAKMDLQRQLLRLREVGEANKQITTYNEAIHFANLGQTKKAIEILDKLLETATDAAVIRDATEFRDSLRKRGSKGMRGR